MTDIHADLADRFFPEKRRGLKTETFAICCGLAALFVLAMYRREKTLAEEHGWEYDL